MDGYRSIQIFGFVIDIVQYIRVAPDLGIEGRAAGLKQPYYLPIGSSKLWTVTQGKVRKRVGCIPAHDEFVQARMKEASSQDPHVFPNLQHRRRDPTNLDISIRSTG